MSRSIQPAASSPTSTRISTSIVGSLIYLKIERIEDYSTVRPQDKVVPPVQYGRDCLRGDGHENALIPEAEIQARKLTAVVYRCTSTRRTSSRSRTS